MGSFRALSHGGLTNSQTSYDDVMGVTRALVTAFCKSSKCCGKKYKVRKVLVGRPDYCPDCHDALVYKTIQTSAAKA